MTQPGLQFYPELLATQRQGDDVRQQLFALSSPPRSPNAVQYQFQGRSSPGISPHDTFLATAVPFSNLGQHQLLSEGTPTPFHVPSLDVLGSFEEAHIQHPEAAFRPYNQATTYSGGINRSPPKSPSMRALPSIPNLLVAGLDETITLPTLRRIFSAYGVVKYLMIKRRAGSGATEGWGFVYMDSLESAQRAIEGLDKTTPTGGGRLAVHFAKQKAEAIETKEIFIRNLPPCFTKENLLELVRPSGTAEVKQLIVDQTNATLNGRDPQHKDVALMSAIVQFGTVEEARYCIEMLDGAIEGPRLEPPIRLMLKFHEPQEARQVRKEQMARQSPKISPGHSPSNSRSQSSANLLARSGPVSPVSQPMSLDQQGINIVTANTGVLMPMHQPSFHHHSHPAMHAEPPMPVTQPQHATMFPQHLQFAPVNAHLVPVTDAQGRVFYVPANQLFTQVTSVPVTSSVPVVFPAQHHHTNNHSISTPHPLPQFAPAPVPTKPLTPCQPAITPNNLFPKVTVGFSLPSVTVGPTPKTTPQVSPQGNVAVHPPNNPSALTPNSSAFASGIARPPSPPPQPALRSDGYLFFPNLSQQTKLKDDDK